MSDYTPTTEDVRACYAQGAILRTEGGTKRGDFDRWLAEHNRQERERVAIETVGSGTTVIPPMTPLNGRWWSDEDLAEHDRQERNIAWTEGYFAYRDAIDGNRLPSQVPRPYAPTGPTPGGIPGLTEAEATAYDKAIRGMRARGCEKCVGVTALDGRLMYCKACGTPIKQADRPAGGGS